jgi:hypothetical protein
MSALGRIGGSVRSARKASAARENGRRGGRPKRSAENLPAAPVPAVVEIRQAPARSETRPALLLIKEPKC